MTSPLRWPGRSSRRTRLMPIGSCSRSEPETGLGAIDVDAGDNRQPPPPPSLGEASTCPSPSGRKVRGNILPFTKHPLFLDFCLLRCHLPAVGAAPREAALSFYARGSVPREIRAMKAL